VFPSVEALIGNSHKETFLLFPINAIKSQSKEFSSNQKPLLLHKGKGLMK